MSTKLYCDSCGKEIGEQSHYKTISKTIYHKTNGRLRDCVYGIELPTQFVEFKKDLCIDCYNKNKTEGTI